MGEKNYMVRNGTDRLEDKESIETDLKSNF